MRLLTTLHCSTASFHLYTYSQLGRHIPPIKHRASIWPPQHLQRSVDSSVYTRKSAVDGIVSTNMTRTKMLRQSTIVGSPTVRVNSAHVRREECNYRVMCLNRLMSLSTSHVRRKSRKKRNSRTDEVRTAAKWSYRGHKP